MESNPYNAPPASSPPPAMAVTFRAVSLTIISGLLCILGSTLTVAGLGLLAVLALFVVVSVYSGTFLEPPERRFHAVMLGFSTVVLAVGFLLVTTGVAIWQRRKRTAITCLLLLGLIVTAIAGGAVLLKLLSN